MNNFNPIKQRANNFTIVNNEILRDKNLSLKAKGLLCFMLHLPSDWKFNEKGLCTVTGEGLTSIKSGLKELEKAKYLYRVKARADKGSFSSMMYYLFDEPTDMQVNGQSITSKGQQPNDIPTQGTFNITKDHEHYDYLNGGWMTE